MSTEVGLKCKHCGVEIAPHANGQGWFHPGNFRGKNTCEIEPYGYSAAPHGEPCSYPCRGVEPGLSGVGGECPHEGIASGGGK